MTFFTVVIRGLWRRPLRTGLTLTGISIGIAAVVALVGMSRGFEKGWQVGLKARGTDIVVSNKSGSLSPKPFAPALRAPVCEASGHRRALQSSRASDERRGFRLDDSFRSRVGRICLEQSRAYLRTDAAR